METKICTKCGRELPIDHFYWRDKKAGRRRSECKQCHNGYVKQKYQERKEDIDDLKSSLKCAKCGDDRSYVLDFHHKDPKEKDNTISRLTAHQASKEKLNQELQKCICLCANCHREFHYLENQNGLTLDEYLKVSEN